MTTLHLVELGVLGPLQVRQDGAPVMIPGAKPRALLTMLGLHGGSVVPAETLVELLWGEDPPRTASKALQTHISSLRRALGDGFVLTEGAGWSLAGADVDAVRYKSAARLGRDAAAAGDTGAAVARFEEALALWRGIPELPDGRRGTSEKTRWIESHAALVEDRADALLATGRAAELVGELEAAVADAPLRERRWGQLMLALYRAGRQGEALSAYQRARALLAEELGVDPGPELRRLEAAVVAQDATLEVAVAQNISSVTRAVTFLLTDIEGSTAAWEADAGAMAVALARHDELVEQVVTSRGGRLIKTRGEGDATFSVFERPSGAAAAAIELQEAIGGEPWALREPMRVRVALHTGEVELRDGDYFGRAVNRAARLRSLATGGQILCSGATAELVIDTLPDDVALADLGTRQLRNLARPEHVFELRLAAVEEPAAPAEAPLERPGLPAVLAGPGPFVGRGRELERLFVAWQSALAGATNAVLIAGEPGVGKTRLAGEWSRQAYDQGALVLYGRCDEDLGAPYQPFAEALRSLVPCLGSGRLGGLRGVEALLPLVPGLIEVLPDVAAPTRADPDTERYALFDAVVAVLGVAAAGAPVVLILDDLHWAAKPTLLLLRHLLRFGEQTRVQVVGTYRSTDLDRSHPLAAMLADLHRDGTANRIALGGLDEDDVTAYVAEAGYDDEELARALASVTGGNPFFLIEALRHVDESGGHWDPSTLPQGVREAVSRRLSRLPTETNKALAAAAVVGARFAVDLVERVVDQDLIDAFDEACKAGIIIEEPGGRYRFNHALVRQSLLAELPSVRRMRLHQRIAATLENESGADDDELLAELAYHYFECAWAGNAAKAVEYCRRAADQAMTRLAYEGAAELYDRALHALEEIDEELPDRDEQVALLLIARCEALLAAGDVASAASAIPELQRVTAGSARLAAWAACFDGQLSMLIHPERLDEVESAVGAAARTLAELDDAAGEAKAHTVRAGCLARLGRIGDCEIALDDALTAARRAGEHRRVNAVLANAPLAALWGPNPVPRAGGRCLDVVRLLRITTDSPAVEATSTRCQAVLEAFRGRAAPARRMIESARRTVTELGLRHALLEVEQFAGIVELVADDPAAAESHLRLAYNGFRRMRLDADTAETAALLGRACLALGRDVEADELCSESERLAGHALKPSIAWRTLRAHLLSRGGDHDGARRYAEAAVGVAERTDVLVDHADACLALAVVLRAAGDAAGAHAAAERAVGLYERKGAAALAERTRQVLGESTASPMPPEAPTVAPTNACVQAGNRLIDAVNREAWEEVAQLLAPYVSTESRRKIVGFSPIDVPASQWPKDMRRYLEKGMVRYHHTALAVRGERLALSRLEIGTADRSSGAPQDEMLQVVGIDEEGRIALQVKFDVDDIDAAMAELEATHARLQQESPPARRLENTATRVFEHVWSHYAARDWDAMADSVADDYVGIDHRRVVSAETQHGREVVIRDLKAAADVGFTISMVSALAIRGQRLVLARVRASASDPAAIQNDALNVIEIDTDDRIAKVVTFDIEDFDAAIAELETRYVAGEAADYSLTWSIIAAAYTAMNRRELPATTPDWVNIDHRRGAAFAPGDLAAYIRATFDAAPDVNPYIEAVHQLSNLGAVVTHASHATSQEGFEAEWRYTVAVTVEGDLINRCELFDETDLDAALARFDQLSRPGSPPENAASRADDRVNALFAERRWDEIDALLADDIQINDRRRGLRRDRGDRAGEIANARVIAEIGVKTMTSQVLAIRGNRLALTRTVFSGRDQRPEAFRTELLRIAEIGTTERIVAYLAFDVDDFDAAIAELDARYLAGEAAPYANTWPVIAGAYAALNRHEIAATKADFASIDHRRGTKFAPGDLIAYIRATWDLAQDASIYVEAVHQLNGLGAVVTHVTSGRSQEGFDAEWREVFLLTVEGDVLSRCELFDEADVDAAIARFNQLSRLAPPLENAASRSYDRLQAHYAARDWSAISAMLSEDHCSDDRRAVVGDGIQHGRDALIENLRTVIDVGVTQATSHTIATRGERLALALARYSRSDEEPAAFHVDYLQLVEIGADERITALVAFDLDKLDDAYEELETRYLAGEAAPYAHVWQIGTEALGELNRHEPGRMLAALVYTDHRHVGFASGDYGRAVEELWGLVPDARYRTTEVYALDTHGSVFKIVIEGTDLHGNELHWPRLSFLSVGPEGARVEVYDEDDVDAALARFEELRPEARPLENAASRAAERYLARYAARDWDALAKILAADIVTDDRRRVVNAGIRHGRDAEIAGLRAYADAGITHMTFGVLAARGQRIILVRASGAGGDSGDFRNELLAVVEINSQNQIAALVVFDLDDFESGLAELDARYLASEAAAHANAWSVITNAIVAHNRREVAATTTNAVSADHRRVASFAPGQGIEYLRAGWDLDQTLNVYIETVHRLNDLGAVFTWAAYGASHEGFEAEWRGVNLMTVDGEMVDRSEIFDEGDLDAALAKFDQLGQRAPRLENTASQAYERIFAWFAARDWDAIADIVADEFSSEDRRRVVNAGVRRGRDAGIEDVRAIADVGFALTMVRVLTTRGGRLALLRVRAAGPDPGAIKNDALNLVEVDTDERVVASVVFDLDNFEAAVAELDARYLAGEAAAHSRVWSIVAGSYAALNRRRLPLTTPECLYVDHRRETAFGPGDLTAYIGAGLESGQDINVYVELVHRLNGLGAVITYAAHETSHEGFAAEWRGIAVFTVDGDLVDRCEVFDEADTDAAIERLEQLSRPARLENAASQVCERYLAHYAARDWDAMAEVLAHDFSSDDRRRVVSAGVRHGRDAQVANMKAFAALAIARVTATSIATRGERLVLQRVSFSDRDRTTDAFLTERLGVGEINAEGRIAAFVSFDLDDIGAAITELDARYLAGEAAAQARTWSLIAGAYAAFNRREFLATTPDWVDIDHRRGAAFAPGDMIAYIQAAWEDSPDTKIYIAAVHRLSNIGAVVTHVAHGMSQEGFDAEWRDVHVLTVQGDRINRCELFDESDLDAALARLEELQPQAPRLENAASQVTERFVAHYLVREWAAMAEILANDFSSDDRRRMVGAGVRHGRDAQIADMRAIADLSLRNMTSINIATRGERLVLVRSGMSFGDQLSEGFRTEVLGLVELDTAGRMVALVSFDLDDIDAAFEELDARYLAGEAATHASTWSVVAGIHAAFNRGELPTADWLMIDHRRGTPFTFNDPIPSIRAKWDITPGLRIHAESVHRLSDVGAVVTHTQSGTSREGFDAEWRMIQLLTVEGGRINRCELFDEADLDVALARYDELSREARLVGSTASRVCERFSAHLAAGDWGAIAASFADNFSLDDRRRVVGAGVRHGRDEEMTDLRALADLGWMGMTSTVLATRGERVFLVRARMSFSDREQGSEAYLTELFGLVEIAADERIVGLVGFDLDDIDAAFEELDTRYLAGEAAAHAHTWSVITNAYAAVNRRESPPTTPDWVSVDHRRGIAFPPGGLGAYLNATWDLFTPGAYIETVHLLSRLGAVVTRVVKGRSPGGFDAEWREIGLSTVEGGLINRSEIFDETDLDAALARFDELHPRAQRLENAASHAVERYFAHFAARDWNAMAEMVADNFANDDRRRVVGAGIYYGADTQMADMRAIAELWSSNVPPTMVATRGDRLVLTRLRFEHRDQGCEAFATESLSILETNADEQGVAFISFDVDDVDAAFEELDARYLAGEAAAHGHAWTVITQAFAVLNQGEIPTTTPALVDIDHRPLAPLGPGDLKAYLRTALDDSVDTTLHIEAVHRLTDLGAVVTHAAKATSREGFDAEWRLVDVFTVEGDLISRCEIFDEADLDAALAKFDELDRPGATS